MTVDVIELATALQEVANGRGFDSATFTVDGAEIVITRKEVLAELLDEDSDDMNGDST